MWLKEKYNKIKQLEPSRMVQAAVAVLIVGLALAVMIVFRLTRAEPEKIEKSSLAPLVEAVRVRRADIEMVVEGYGTVEPKVAVEVVPQISGKIVAVHEKFQNGGLINAGETLIEIDRRDYELAVESAKAAVAQAQVNLDVEEAEAEVALHEWRQIHGEKKPASPLVLREPQVRQSKTRLEAAGAELAKAELNLQRTIVSLPYACRVVEENVDVGQYVTAGQAVGHVYGIEAVEIAVPVEDWELAWFEVPVINNTEWGSEAVVIQEFAGGSYKWQGKVVRSGGEIDRKSRLVPVIVTVKNPFEVNGGRPALVPGMFVKVQIKGKVLKQAFAVPGYTVHGADQLWVVRDDRLEIVKVEIARRDSKYAYVISGLQEGDLVVLSSLDAVTSGMKIRIERVERN